MTSINSCLLPLCPNAYAPWSYWIGQSLGASFSPILLPNVFLHELPFHFLTLPLILLSTCPDFASVFQNLQPWIYWTSCHIHCSSWIIENWKKPLWIGTNINWWLSITPLSLSLVSLLVFELLPIVLPYYPQLKLSPKPYSQHKSVPISLGFQSISLSLTYKHGCL